MQVVEGLVACPRDACWQAFTDVAKLTQWVPGLRDARVIEEREDGLPAEIQFEYMTGSIYSLIYDYDLAGFSLAWRPRPGEHGGVRGEVSFEEIDRGTKMTYSIEQAYGRRAAERAFDDPHALVAAFTRYVEA